MAIRPGIVRAMCDPKSPFLLRTIRCRERSLNVWIRALKVDVTKLEADIKGTAFTVVYKEEQNWWTTFFAIIQG